MKMIRHEDIGVKLPAGLSANLAQRLNEALAIRIIHEDQFAAVTAIHDVINPTSILDSQLADRPVRVLWLLYISISRTDPFFVFRPGAIQGRSGSRHERVCVNSDNRPLYRLG